MSNRVTCFISYSRDVNNFNMFNSINNLVSSPNYVNYTERKNKREFSDETIWNYLLGRIKGASCTILLLTEDLLSCNKNKISYVHGSFIDSGWVYNEISASLRDWKDNRINALVCVIEDNIVNKIKNFNASGIYYLPKILEKNIDYIVFVTYSYFMKNHWKYINEALQKRNIQINSNGTTFNIVYDLHNR